MSNQTILQLILKLKIQITSLFPNTKIKICTKFTNYHICYYNNKEQLKNIYVDRKTGDMYQYKNKKNYLGNIYNESSFINNL